MVIEISKKPHKYTNDLVNDKINYVFCTMQICGLPF